MSDQKFDFEVVRAQWDADDTRVIEEVRLLGTSIGWDKLDECRECQAVLDQFGRCHYCDRSWTWGYVGEADG